MGTRSNDSKKGKRGPPELKFSTPRNFSTAWAEELTGILLNQFSTLKSSIADINKSINEVKSELTSSINGVQTNLDSINTHLVTQLNTVNETANKASETANKNAEAIVQLQSDMSDLKNAYQTLKSENDALKNQCNKTEQYTRRDNLIFYGINEEENESVDQCERGVRSFFVDKLRMEEAAVNEIKFVRCHRLIGSKHDAVRPVIVRFREYHDREKIWKALKKLPRKSSHYITEDFPVQVVFNRRKLLPIFSKARGSTNNKKSVTLRGDKLIINDETYTVNNLGHLKGELHPSKMSNKNNTSVHVFGGIFSDHCALSNYGKYPVNHDGHMFPTAEHAFVYYKCVEAGDMGAAKRVFQKPEPYQAKSIGAKLRINIAEWDRKKNDILKKVLVSKFSAGSEAAKALLETGNKTLGEAGLDRYYGTGIPITRNNSLDKKAWIGTNVLGNMLMDIRTELQT